MTIYAGTVANFDGMALAIEEAFANELFNLKGTQLPESSKDERRMLFSAIAQGVLYYLHDHQTDLPIVTGPDDRLELQIDLGEGL